MNPGECNESESESRKMNPGEYNESESELQDEFESKDDSHEESSISSKLNEFQESRVQEIKFKLKKATSAN
jgi:hypothetical protein